MPFKNIEKRKQYRKEWYRRNRLREIKFVKKRKNLIRKWFEDYKNKVSCVMCGESHPATIDFHHQGRKDFEIAHMVSNGYSLNRIMIELRGCLVLCSNCHRKLHYKNNKLKNP